MVTTNSSDATAARRALERLERAIDIIERNLNYHEGQRPLGWRDLLRARDELEAALAAVPPAEPAPRERERDIVMTERGWVDRKHNDFKLAEPAPPALVPCDRCARLEAALDEHKARVRKLEQERDALQSYLGAVQAGIRDTLHAVLAARPGTPEPSDTYRVDSVTTHERTGVQRERHLTGQTETSPLEKHRCCACGHQWKGELKGAELCGDCWRAAWARRAAAVTPQTDTTAGDV